jgi:hypothetical protein
MVIQDQTETTILDTRSKVQLPHYYSELNFIQRIKLRLNGMVHVGDHMEEGWKTSLPYYAFRCEKHGLQLDYPSGHAQKLLCPDCIQAAVK